MGSIIRLKQIGQSVSYSLEISCSSFSILSSFSLPLISYSWNYFGSSKINYFLYSDLESLWYFSKPVTFTNGFNFNVPMETGKNFGCFTCFKILRVLGSFLTEISEIGRMKLLLGTGELTIGWWKSAYLIGISIEPHLECLLFAPDASFLKFPKSEFSSNF